MFYLVSAELLMCWVERPIFWSFDLNRWTICCSPPHLSVAPLGGQPCASRCPSESWSAGRTTVPAEKSHPFGDFYAFLIRDPNHQKSTGIGQFLSLRIPKFEKQPLWDSWKRVMHFWNSMSWWQDISSNLVCRLAVEVEHTDHWPWQRFQYRYRSSTVWCLQLT
jgi:hypothetical protein